TPRGDYRGTLEAIASLVREIDEQLGLKQIPVGVGTPGTISPATGLVKNSNSSALNGKPLDKDLAALLGRPVRLANDANCFALSEAVDGAAAGAPVVFGVILGTGVGGGVVVDGKILVGANAIAGEWGHNPLPWPKADELPGPPCSCGRRGCIESFLCGPALARDHGGKNAPTAQDVARLAGEGDPQANAAMERYEERLARALAHVVNILDPNVVVLGGGLSNVERLYADVPRLWGRFVFSDRVDTKLVRAKHGDSSGVRGAARLFGA
ncbi:MAG TPA: ROK family protein, partial [Elusimicrobiota bacterium]|nr:ROK family protein [Elusimicrobiota bacterium]